MIVVFLVYIDKLVCSNSDINQEVIMEQCILGINRGSNMESTNQLLVIVRNNQY